MKRKISTLIVTVILVLATITPVFAGYAWSGHGG